MNQLKFQKDDKLIKWIRDRVDYSREMERKPYSFYRGASFSDCLLPTIAEMPYTLRNPYIQTVVDEDMKSDLEDSQSINWCNPAVKLLPVQVPKDGNCLLHAASMAVWGVEDSQNILRDLMLMTAQISDCFKKRWWSQLMKNLHSLQITQHEIIDNEWDDIIRSISDLGSSSLSVAVPHRFLEGIHIYILANILRRPIIVVTNGHAKSLTGVELQENHIGGLYLPLEWPSIECCKTPIILGYSYSHFCPLLSETQPHFLVLQKKRETPIVFPLVHVDLSCLVVRYLTDQEDPIAWDLVQSYLSVKEMDVVEKTGTVTKVPFAQMYLAPLRPDQNSLFEHFELLKKKFIENEFQKTLKSPPRATLEAGQQSSHPFYDIEMSSQTQVVRVNTLKDKTANLQEKQKRMMPSDKYVQEANQNTANQNTTNQNTANQNTTNQNTTNQNTTNQNTTNQCIFEGCSNVGNPNLQNFCEHCIKTLATAEVSAPSVGHTALSPVKIAAPPKENILSKMIQEANVSSNESHAVNPTAPLLSLDPNEQLLSMMAERCINKCGYRCSKKTYPYCHECYQIEMELAKKIPNTPALNSYEKTGSGNSWVSEIEVAANMSPTLRITAEKDSKILFELRADENNKNIYITRAADKNSALINNTQSSGKQHRAKENVMVNQGEQKYEAINSESLEGFAESLAETDIESITVGDIEVSEEPEWKVKCLSPYCDNYILSQQKLCDKCKDILKKGSQHNHESLKKHENVAITRAVEDQLEREKLLQKQILQQKEKIRPRLEFKRLDSVSRGKPCVMSSCPNYGDPQMNSMCSLCYFKSNPSAKPRRTAETGKKTDKIRSHSSQPLTEKMPFKEVGEPKGGEYSHYTRKTVSASPVRRKGLPNYESTHDPLNKESTCINPHQYQFIQTSGPESTIPSQPHSSSSLSEPTSLIVTSLTEHNTHKSTHQLPPDSSYSFNQNADKDFEKMFGSIEKTLKSTAKKCLSLRCENYGNNATGGYCNSCFKVIRRQRIIERDLQRGVDVPDGEVLQEV